MVRFWSLLHENPDRYIYDAVKKGGDLSLPPEIAVGVEDVAQRGEWNKSASEAYALPTEIWREVAARRARYNEVRMKLAEGEITSINDLITYNLDMRQFAQDAITYCEGTGLLRAFYDSIESVTVLDPTCGSGAFLFAALNILEMLYEACLDRMQIMIDERDQLDAALPANNRQHYPALDHFRKILREVDKHPSRKYFIYKSIIINNLYGVDIMEEATEICKLRLFLKLVSQVDKFDDIEPLPDIDFNIRAGNTLVGFASYEETKKAIEGKTTGKGTTQDEVAFQNQMIFDDRLERIEQKAQEIERAFDHFRKLQTQLQLEAIDMAENKQHIRQKLDVLRAELDSYLASEFGIDRNNIVKTEVYDEKFAQWQRSHQPFHWWIEFYGIMKRGGFDVIIGNPPYVEYSKIRDQYKIKEYRTETCGNLYTNVFERCSNVLNNAGKSGVIVPLSGFCTERMIPYQNQLLERYNLLYVSFYSGDANPSVMFNGVKHRLAIVLATSDGGKPTLVNTTNYLKWYADERDTLFSKLIYISCPFSIGYLRFAKVGCSRTASVLQKMMLYTPLLGDYIRRVGQGHINYHRTPVSWIRAMNFEPYFHSASRDRSLDHLRDLYLDTQQLAYSVGAILNSTLFYHWFLVQGNCRDITGYDIASFPVGVLENQIVGALEDVFIRLMDDLRVNSKPRVYNYEYSGRVEYQEFYPKLSKPIIDEIDRILANHYGFTDEELDFIINYDIKYRMGRKNGDESEE